MEGLLPVGHTGIPRSCVWGAGAAQCSVPPCWEASRARNTWEKSLNFVSHSVPRSRSLVEQWAVADLCCLQSSWPPLVPCYIKETPPCQMCCITFPFSRIRGLSKLCHVYVDSQAPILQSFPFSSANTHPIKLSSYHGFLLTNLGSLDVKLVEKKKCFLVRKCAHWADGLKILCSAHFVFEGLMMLLWGVLWVPKSMEREELVNGLPWQMHCFQSQFKQPERRTGAGECLLEYLNVLLEMVCCW